MNRGYRNNRPRISGNHVEDYYSETSDGPLEHPRGRGVVLNKPFVDGRHAHKHCENKHSSDNATLSSGSRSDSDGPAEWFYDQVSAPREHFVEMQEYYGDDEDDEDGSLKVERQKTHQNYDIHSDESRSFTYDSNSETSDDDCRHKCEHGDETEEGDETDDEESMTFYENLIIDMIAETRRMYGVPPLRIDLRLQHAAYLHAKNLAETNQEAQNTGPNGTTLQDRLDACSYNFKWAGQTVGVTPGDCVDIFAEWLDGVKSKKKISKDEARDVGVRVLWKNEKYYYVSVFGVERGR